MEHGCRADGRVLDAKMAETVSLPIWVVVVAGVFSLWAILDRLIVPSTRWLFRQHVSRVINELNTRLQLQIPPFQQTKRQVLIGRRSQIDQLGGPSVRQFGNVIRN